MKRLCFLACAVASLFLAGCATTPTDRIKKNQELFDSFPPEVQEKIKKDEVVMGFTPDMVLMAKDKPDRKYTRQTAKGENEVWAYIGTYTTADRQRVQTRVHAPDVGGVWHYYNDWVWVDVQRQHEFDQFRVEFEDGKVSAFETMTERR
jgi:hypothetical protein